MIRGSRANQERPYVGGNEGLAGTEVGRRAQADFAVFLFLRKILIARRRPEFSDLSGRL
jgi:hypothetical protein